MDELQASKAGSALVLRPASHPSPAVGLRDGWTHSRAKAPSGHRSWQPSPAVEPQSKHRQLCEAFCTYYTFEILTPVLGGISLSLAFHICKQAKLGKLPT